MRKVGLLFMFLCVPVLGYSATVNVPADYATIMDAVNAVVDGDTVEVSPGTYVENVDYLGKAITIKSTDGPVVTVIDGSAWTNPDVLSTVVFMTGEGLDSVLEGFTITGGNGTLGLWADYHGAGIHISSASPTIKGNIITGNTVAGLYSGGGAIHSAYGDPMVTDNLMVGNWAHYSGGGFDCTGGNPTLENNVILGNRAGGDYGAFGGGVSINASDYAVLKNNLVACNVSVTNAGASGTPKGGGVTFWNSDFPEMTNTTIVGNQSTQGGGIVAGYNTFPTITDCICWDNFAVSGTGKEVYIYATPCDVTMDFTDLEGLLGSCYVAGGCNLFLGGAMIDADPLFTAGPDGLYYLSQIAAGQAADSPCWNAGSDLASNLGMDAYWTRTDEVADDNDVDMGFHYGPFPVPSLMANIGTIPESTGGPAEFTLNAGVANASREYLLLGGISGTNPGLSLGPGKSRLLLNWDVFTNLVIQLIPSSFFVQFAGTLDTSGKEKATMNLPAVPASAGITMSFAYVLKGYDYSSNPWNIIIVD